MADAKNELIPLSAPSRWKDVLKSIPHAFGHTWESCYAMSLTSGYPTFLYFFQDKDAKIVCPIAEREYNGYIDIVTPYGFSGFSGTNEYSKFPEQWLKFVRSQGYVCGYIGLNPVFEKNSYFDKSDLSEHHTIYVLDLQLSIEQLFYNLSNNRKRQLKNYTDIQFEIVNEKPQLGNFFISNYHSFFRQRKHGSAYDLNLDTLSFLIDSENVFLNGIIVNKKLVSVAIFAYTPYCGEYLFNISLEKNYTTPLIWNAIHYLKSINIPFLNLGGGVNNSDSIADFKQRFGGIKLPLKCLKQIYNEEIYEKLSKPFKGFETGDHYFPVYWSSRPDSL